MIESKKVISLLEESFGIINELIRLVGEQASQKELSLYKGVAGNIMGNIYIDILRGIYRKDPELAPEGLEP